jgi:hypothetical protein
VHSRTPALLLRKNLIQRPEALLNASERTLHLRRNHYLHFSSRIMSRRSGSKKWADTVRVIESSSWNEFKKEILTDLCALVRDMFPELSSAGKVGSGTPVRETTSIFSLPTTGRLNTQKAMKSVRIGLHKLLMQQGTFLPVCTLGTHQDLAMHVCGAQCSQSPVCLSVNLVR